jgi:polysaccharide export outer membrane protein
MMMLKFDAPSRGSAISRLRVGASHAVSALVLSSFLGSAIMPAAAQVTDPYATRNVPVGSPLDPSGDGSSSSSRTSRDSTVTSAQSETFQVEPVEIGSDAEAGNGSDRDGTQDRLTDRSLERLLNPRVKPLVPGEFENYIEQRTGRKIKRFGSDLLLPSNRDYAVPATATVPPDYVLGVGDVVTISMTGSVDGSVDLEIDTDGRAFLPKVGPIRLAGVRYGDLRRVASAAIGRQYRGYEVTVAIKELRGVRVYVTGFANNPGAYSVNSLSTMVNAVLAAGGPASGGSFRSIQLYRKGQLVSDFDLYKLIRNGNRDGDAILQNEDVLFIPPVGSQVAVIGSVNAEAIYETKPEESIADALIYAGGPTDLADKSRVMLYRLSEKDTLGGREVSTAVAKSERIEGGDMLAVLAQGSLARSIERQSVVVRIEGEVNKPGNYYVPPNTKLETVLEMAGGLTSQAFVYGARFERLSVKLQQLKGFEEAIQQMELSIAATPLSQDAAIGGDRAAQRASAQATLDKLKLAEPDGRVILDIPATANHLPGDLRLENNDRIVIPSRPSTVGVFGAVYRPASFIIAEGKPSLRVRDYIARAGSTLRAADTGGIFVVRANGAVLSKRDGALSALVLPGDVIFVPVKTQSSSLWAKIRDISSIVFQFGITAATFVAVAK